jgi:hypothetical protein
MHCRERPLRSLLVRERMRPVAWWENLYKWENHYERDLIDGGVVETRRTVGVNWSTVFWSCVVLAIIGLAVVGGVFGWGMLTDIPAPTDGAY